MKQPFLISSESEKQEERSLRKKAVAEIATGMVSIGLAVLCGLIGAGLFFPVEPRDLRPDRKVAERELLLGPLSCDESRTRAGHRPKKPAHRAQWSTRSMPSDVGLRESTVRRIWHKHGLEPHLVETFKVSTDPPWCRHFAEKLEAVIGLYLKRSHRLQLGQFWVMRDGSHGRSGTPGNGESASCTLS